MWTTDRERRMYTCVVWLQLGGVAQPRKDMFRIPDGFGIVVGGGLDKGRLVWE